MTWFAFLVNDENIKDENVVKFFEKAFVGWFDNQFLEKADNRMVVDDKIYPEMKIIYERFRPGKLKEKMRDRQKQRHRWIAYKT